MTDRVTIIEEHNVHGQGGNASVWLLPCESDPNKTLELETAAVRIVGPVAFPIAEQVLDGLEKSLTACGISVVREITADD